MAEEDKVEMMTLEGLDVRALGERDRIVLGSALGVAARRFRHSHEEEETEDWLARVALDLTVCEDVTTAAKEAVVRVATGGGEGKAVVDLILLQAGASLAMLGRAIRDVSAKPELDVHEGGEGPAASRTGIDLIGDERARQIDSEGWAPDHDDEHDASELAWAAVCYAAPSPVRVEIRPGEDGDPWPFAEGYDKRAKSSRIRELVKAGALIAAEIDRRLRLGEKP